MTNAKLPRITRLAIALAIVAALVAGLLFGDLITSAGDYRIRDYQAGQVSSAATESVAEDVVVAKVAQEEITLAEFTETLQHLQYMKDISQRELDGLLETGLPSEYLQARQDIVTYWGDDSVALAALVLDSVMYQKAVAAGITVTSGEIDESVRLTRNVYENGEMDAYNEGFIESIGAERYWNEVLPLNVERDLMIDKLHDQIAAGSGSSMFNDARLSWHDFTEAALKEADIWIADSEHHSATLEDALGHLESVRELDRSRIQQADDLPRAPTDKWVVHVKPEQGPLNTIHFDDEPGYCHQPATDSHHICDARTGELHIELDSGDLYVIVQPGAILPVFDEER